MENSGLNVLLSEILIGNRTALAKGITLIESTLEADSIAAGNLIEGCLPHAGKSIRIGITGVPGAGKSTFIENLGLKLVREGHKVAVLAVDPSSRISRGSILGDKTRMQHLSVSDQAFIRPSPAGETLGGVARKTRETITLCEAAGYDVVLIETVGVGQSETTVHNMVDFFLLLQLTGAGDELQGIKRGIIEMADGIVVHKADGNNREAARNTQLMLENILHYYPPKSNGWKAHVLQCSSIEQTGFDAVWQLILSYRDHTKNEGHFELNRITQNLHWFVETIESKLLSKFFNKPEILKLKIELESQIKNGSVSPFRAAERVIEAILPNSV